MSRYASVHSSLNLKVLVENRGKLTGSIYGSQERDENDTLCERNVTLPPRNDTDVLLSLPESLSKCFILHAVNFVGESVLRRYLIPFFFFQETPVEFFGLPFDDAVLHEAPFEGSHGILTACNGVLHDIGQGHIYDHHKDLVSKRPEREVKKSFLRELSRLDLEHKQRCFNEIVSTLEKGGEGRKRIRDHLIEGVWNKRIDDTTQIIP